MFYFSSYHTPPWASCSYSCSSAIKFRLNLVWARGPLMSSRPASSMDVDDISITCSNDAGPFPLTATQASNGQFSPPIQRKKPKLAEEGDSAPRGPSKISHSHQFPSLQGAPTSNDKENWLRTVRLLIPVRSALCQCLASILLSKSVQQVYRIIDEDEDSREDSKNILKKWIFDDDITMAYMVSMDPKEERKIRPQLSEAPFLKLVYT